MLDLKAMELLEACLLYNKIPDGDKTDEAEQTIRAAMEDLTLTYIHNPPNEEAVEGLINLVVNN